MLADVVEMPGPALLAVHLEAHEGARLPALLSRGASVSEGIGEPLELWLMLALAYLSVLRRSMALFESFLAAAAYEDSVFEPLLSTRLLGRMSLPLLSSGGGLYDRSAWVKHARNAYMMRAPEASSSSEASDSEVGTSSVRKAGGCQSGGREGTMSSSRGRPVTVGAAGVGAGCPLCMCACCASGGRAWVRVLSIIIFIIIAVVPAPFIILFTYKLKWKMVPRFSECLPRGVFNGKTFQFLIGKCM